MQVSHPLLHYHHYHRYYTCRRSPFGFFTHLAAFGVGIWIAKGWAVDRMAHDFHQRTEQFRQYQHQPQPDYSASELHNRLDQFLAEYKKTPEN